MQGQSGENDASQRNKRKKSRILETYKSFIDNPDLTSVLGEKRSTLVKKVYKGLIDASPTPSLEELLKIQNLLKTSCKNFNNLLRGLIIEGKKEPIIVEIYELKDSDEEDLVEIIPWRMPRKLFKCHDHESQQRQTLSNDNQTVAMPQVSPLPLDFNPTVPPPNVASLMQGVVSAGSTQQFSSMDMNAYIGQTPMIPMQQVPPQQQLFSQVPAFSFQQTHNVAPHHFNTHQTSVRKSHQEHPPNINRSEQKKWISKDCTTTARPAPHNNYQQRQSQFSGEPMNKPTTRPNLPESRIHSTAPRAGCTRYDSGRNRRSRFEPLDRNQNKKNYGESSSNCAISTQSRNQHLPNASKRPDDRTYSQGNINKKQKTGDTSTSRDERNKPATDQQPSKDNRDPRSFKENKNARSTTGKSSESNVSKKSDSSRNIEKNTSKNLSLNLSGKKPGNDSGKHSTNVNVPMQQSGNRTDPRQDDREKSSTSTNNVQTDPTLILETVTLPVLNRSTPEPDPEISLESMIPPDRIKKESSFSLSLTATQLNLGKVFEDNIKTEVKTEFSDAETISNPDTTADTASFDGDEAKRLKDFDELAGVNEDFVASDATILVNVKIEADPEEEKREDITEVKTSFIRVRNLNELIGPTSWPDLPNNDIDPLVEPKSPLYDGEEPFDDDDEESDQESNPGSDDNCIVPYIPGISQPPP